MIFITHVLKSNKKANPRTERRYIIRINEYNICVGILYLWIFTCGYHGQSDLIITAEGIDIYYYYIIPNIYIYIYFSRVKNEKQNLKKKNL